MADQGLKQHVATEPEARLMRMGHHGFKVAYNAQAVVNARHKLIVAFDLTNEGNDSRQLYPMAAQAKEELQVKRVTVVADSGYSNGKQGSKCEQSGITAIVPRPRTVNKRGKGFSRDEFAYDAKTDSWRCPAGAKLTRSRVSLSGQKNDYTTKICGDCGLKAQCTKSRRRVVVRNFYEDALEAMHQRAMSEPWMKQRSRVVEHSFGTIKWMMSNPRFLLRGLKKAKAELALSVLGYNLKPVINISIYRV
jgi:transcription elongation factor Elf1